MRNAIKFTCCVNIEHRALGTLQSKANEDMGIWRD